MSNDFWRPGNHVLGAGVVYFDDGNGERPIIETDQFTVLVEAETAERWGAVDGPVQLVDARIVRVRRSATIGTTDIIAENVAMLFGAEEVTAVAMGTTYNAPSTAAGLWYQCTSVPGPFTLTSVVFTNELTPVLGEHYDLDATRGRVQVLEDGLGELDVEFTASAVSLLDLQPQVEVRGALRFLADPTRGDGFDFYFPSVVIRPGGPLDTKSRSDWMRLGLDIDILGEPRRSARAAMSARRYTS